MGEMFGMEMNGLEDMQKAFQEMIRRMLSPGMRKLQEAMDEWKYNNEKMYRLFPPADGVEGVDDEQMQQIAEDLMAFVQTIKAQVDEYEAKHIEKWGEGVLDTSRDEA